MLAHALPKPPSARASARLRASALTVGNLQRGRRSSLAVWKQLWKQRGRAWAVNHLGSGCHRCYCLPRRRTLADA